MIEITDDGDEVLYIWVDGVRLAEIDHDLYGWAGMYGVMKVVEALGKALDVEVVNTQDIV